MAQLGEGSDDQTNRPDNEHAESTIDKRFSLHDLTHDDNPHELFISEIQRIFQYRMKDILEIISELDRDVLSSIHNTLANMAKTDFPKFKDRRAVQRTVAHTAAKDIWFLGFSISNQTPSKELEKIFKDNISETDVTTTHTEQPHHVIAQIEVLIQTMNTFDTKMKALQTQVNILQNDNALLHTQLAANATNNQSVTTVLLSAEDGTTELTPAVVPSCSEPTSESDGENFQIQRHQRKKLNKKAKRDRRKVKHVRPESQLQEQQSKLLKENNKCSLKTYTAIAKQTMAQAALSKLKSAPQCQQTAAHTTDSDTTHISISGAHCDTDEAQLKAHLDEMNVTGCIVKDVSSKNQHRDWKSYKVTAPSQHAKQILSRDNWPDGIRVRPFHPSRRNQPFQLKRPSRGNNCNEEQRHGHNQYGQRKRRNNTHTQRQTQPWAR